MLVTEVKTLLRAYCDEPDETFLSVANVESYLARGYDEFRRKVSALDPYIFINEIDISVSGSSYDLALPTNPVILLGPKVPVGTQRMMDLVSIRLQSSSAPYQGFQFKGTSGLKGILNTSRTYALVGTVLVFSESVSDTIVLSYIPEQDTDWAAGSFIDDLSMFHDMIALYAFKQYQIRDSAYNKQLMTHLAQREAELSGYVVDRNVDASHYIQRTMGSYEGF